MTIEMKFLDEVARDLPIIRPLKEFIHLNLLLPYQHLHFWDALKLVAHKLEAMPLPDLGYFRERIKSGQIPLSLIDEKVQALGPQSDKEKIYEHIFRSQFDFSHHDPRVGILHDQWNEHIGVNIMQLADGMLIKWLGMFIDQGIGHWQMPGSEKLSFYECVRVLVMDSLIKPSPFKRREITELFPANPQLAIERHLNFLCPSKELQKEYCSESILTLRGWAGMVFTLQQHPQLLHFPRKISLIDFLAVKLVLERAWVSFESNSLVAPDFQTASGVDYHHFQDEDLFSAYKICQEAHEEATYHKILKHMDRVGEEQRIIPLYQAIFCMDDREGSIRGHLESLDSRIETFGAAGHFGIECLYHHPDDFFPRKQCPAPVPVKYFLEEKPKGQGKDPRSPLNWGLSHSHALYGVIKLAKNLFFPLAFESIENVHEVILETELQLKCQDKTLTPEGLKKGYDLEEMADVLYSQLQLMGLVHQLAPLIFFIGHGSTSANNPYFATYGCGACSGRPGAANARALSEMANLPEVRRRVAEKYQLQIPDQTHFVAGLHDTCKDTIELYETEKIPEGLRESFAKFKHHLSRALDKNAHERSERFKLVSYRGGEAEARKEVLRRSASLFETRPELGHTDVVLAIVGRRKLTQKMNFEGRSFLQSYDRSIDPEGKILATSLEAVIPVCSGIGLDYFFSRVDNLRFGAGSKLPQNIVGNIGVSHGTESDLLFGLPFQMIDQHRPLRLLVLVEHSPTVALKAIQENASVRQIVYNQWIYYGCYDDVSAEFYFFDNGEMVQKSILIHP